MYWIFGFCEFVFDAAVRILKRGPSGILSRCRCLRSTKRAIGGKLVMVEREADRPKLLEFYKANGFKSWTTRRNAKDGVVYDQMFASL